MLGWSKEIIYIISYFFLSVSNTLPFVDVTHGEFDPAKPNIVLVYGMSATPPVMLPLKHKLENAGFNVIIADIGWAKEDIDILAIRFDQFLKKREGVLYVKHGFSLSDMEGRIILFGHSMGGLIIVAAQRHNRELLKLRVVSAGTPFEGTPAAYISFWRRPAYQMRPGSQWLKELVRDMKAHPRKLLAVRAKNDEMVPASSSIPEDHPHYVTPFVGHAALVFELEPEVLWKLMPPHFQKRINENSVSRHSEIFPQTMQTP